jgi:WD40 repeat protein
MNCRARMAFVLALLVNPLICSSHGTRAAEEEPTILRAPDGPVYSISISPDGRTLASCGGYGNGILLWDLKTGKQVATLNDHTDQVWRARISPDGKLLASCSEDGTIILWDLHKRKQSSIIKPASRQVYSELAFSPDGKGLVSGSSTDEVLDY